MVTGQKLLMELGICFGITIVRENPAFLLTGLSEIGINFAKEKVEAWLDKNKDIELLDKDDFKSLEIPYEQRDEVRQKVKYLLRECDLRQYNYDSGQLAAQLCEQYCSDNGIKEPRAGWIKKALERAGDKMIHRLWDEPAFASEMTKVICNICLKIEELEKRSYPSIRDDKAENYRRKWTEPLYLERGQKRATLKEVYQELRYQWKDKAGTASLGLDELFHRCLWSGNTNYEDRMLVVRGQPGMGKSTLITYLLNKITCEREIIVYPFADLKKEIWQYNASRIVTELVDDLRLGNKENLSGRVLVLDGFDEINVSGRSEILNNLYDAWVKSEKVKDFTLIVTCRENALPEEDAKKLNCSWITLRTMSETEIGEFAENYWNKTERPQDARERLELFKSMKEVMGIPLMLYMVLALGTDVEPDDTVTEIYNRVFSLGDKGIYYRAHDNNKHEVTWERRNELHQMSKKVALSMWENDPNRAVIMGSKLSEIAEEISTDKSEELREQFFWVRHSEGGEDAEICYIHRSIYEYFVARTIFDTIRDYLAEETDVPDEVTAELAELMSVRVPFSDIERHLEKMVEDSKPSDKVKTVWRDWFGQRLRNGMRPAETNVGGLIWIKREINCFQNYIKLLRPILGRNTENKYCRLWSDDDTGAVAFMSQYIRYAVPQGTRMHLAFLDLSGANLRGANLVGRHLGGAYLRGAYLSGADLRDADLRDADLRGAFLWDTDLRGADLRDADLSGAYLRDTDLTGAQLENTIILKSALEGVKYDRKEMKKAILLKDNGTPVRRLTKEQKVVLSYHAVTDN